MDFDLFGGEKDMTKGKKCIVKETQLYKTVGGKQVKSGVKKVNVTTDVAWLKANCGGTWPEVIKSWLSHAITGIAIVVVAVPEGLPLAVMLSLAYSVKKMLVDKNFVKRLSSCEIMGGANNICSDKTGTLTKNEMTWIKMWVAGSIKDSAEIKSLKELAIDDIHGEIIKEACSCNTLGVIGDADATELAVLKLMQQVDHDFVEMRKKLLPKDDLIRFPFDSTRKRMTTVVDYGEGNPAPTETGFHRRMHTKGAAEKILETCSHYLDTDGSKKEIDDITMKKILGAIDTLAVQALRAIAFAYKDLSKD
jgi:magnesium-transporting ATPase (P-type)